MFLKFGIPSLDELVEVPHPADLSDREIASESIAILGPEGSGKSVLALHLASRYAADCLRRIYPTDEERAELDPPIMPRILYISSDLKAVSAERVWKNFALQHPNTRQVPFERNMEGLERYTSIHKSLTLTLKTLWLGADTTDELVKELLMPKNHPKDSNDANVVFLDLASHTAGDDWSLVNALLVKLQSVKSAIVCGKKSALPHLVIIDSVAGFETFVGRIDAYGNEQSRRSRIAQCLRNAGDRVSIVFVVEESTGIEHLPEEYVTDIVLSLRKRTVFQNSVSTVEVQKARIREHAKGEHPFEIRDRIGTSTGSWENADTPRTRNAYVQVFPSVAHRNHLVSGDWSTSDVRAGKETAGFGITHLDSLLPAEEGDQTTSATDNKRGSGPNNKSGLRAGTVTALFGDPSTGKSALAEKFLAQGFGSIVQRYLYLSALRDAPESIASPEVISAFEGVCASLDENMIEPGQTPAEFRLTAGIAALWPEFASLLKKADQQGQDKTERSLAYLFNGRTNVDWNVRVKASGLANVGVDPLTDVKIQGLRPEPYSLVDPLTDVKIEGLGPGPYSRADWTVDWGEITNGKLEELFRHPSLRRPGVLLTTRDRRGTDVAETCLAYMQSEINDAYGRVKEYLGKNIASTWKNKQKQGLLRILDSQLVVRRFDLRASPAAAVFHLIHRNLTETLKLVFGLAYPPQRDERRKKAGRIRFVIDDLRVLTDINPDLIAETAFLPFLTFLLEREGVVSLLVHTDSLRPNISPEDETSKVLLSILKRAILTWNVPFEGRRRIAISAIPNNRSNMHGIVRELTLNPFKSMNDADDTTRLGRVQDVDVTRHLELYSGIEEGKPVPVPLAVYLFNETPDFEVYVNEEDKLFRELFVSVERRNPVRPGRILFPFDATRFLAIRDRTNLILDMQDAHTLVLQVDEHWALHPPHALEGLSDYLNRKLPFSNDGSPLDEDPFGAFSGPPLSKRPPRFPEKAPQSSSGYGRIDYFVNEFYDGPYYDRPKEANCPDHECRVPYMWDFGFLLTRRAPWEMVKGEPLDRYLKFEQINEGLHRDLMTEAVPTYLSETDNESQQCKTVKDVFDTLSGSGSEGVRPRAVSWRKFFGACKQVAIAHREQTSATTIPFEIAAPSSETINSLVLEIWLSELVLEANILDIDLRKLGFADVTKRTSGFDVPALMPEGSFRIDKVVGLIPHSGDQSRPREKDEIAKAFAKFAEASKGYCSSNLLELFKQLPLGAFCLYKTWLLLSEVFDFENFLDANDAFTLRQGGASSVHAVASRHWYKTACTFSKELYASEGIHDSLVAMRLPGSYSTRGDWFLGYTKSSRSRLLAEHAMDLMSSRRGNITRMQRGLGLPVRDFVGQGKCGEFRTALVCMMERSGDDDKQMSSPIDFLPYGELCKLGKMEGSSEIEWLFRSRIQDYDRLSRPLQKWLARVFRWSGSGKRAGRRGLKGGFAAYDELTCKCPSKEGYEGFVEFGTMCDFLQAAVTAAMRDAEIDVATVPTTS